MKIRFALVLMLSVIAPADADEWKTLLWLPNLRITQDQDSLKVEGKVISAWQRWTYDQDQVFNGIAYRVGRYLIYTDCEHNTRANAHVELLSESGAVVFSQKPPVFVFAPLRPDSLPEAVHKKICSST